MAINIKGRRTGTQHQCPECKKKGFPLSGTWSSRNYFKCDCAHRWHYGLEHCSIQAIKLQAGQVLTMFHGSWLPEERTAVEEALRKVFAGSRGCDWAFFKGRQIYSGWRMRDGDSSTLGTMVMSPSLMGLIEKVVVKCRQEQSL